MAHRPPRSRTGSRLALTVVGLALALAHAAGSGAGARMDVHVFLPAAARLADLGALPVPPTAPPSATAEATSPTVLPSPSATATPSSPTETPPPHATATPTPLVGPTASPTTPPTPPADCGAIPTFEDGKTPSAELHVTVHGDDATGDGSLARPFATLGRAARAAGPGTAIRVHAGTYGGGQWVEGLRGTADAPIWIGGAPGELRPVLEGEGEGLHLVRPAYVVVHDLEILGSRHNGINADDGGAYADETAAHHVVFRDLAINDVGGDGNQDCLKLSGLRHFHVLGSSFARCGGGMSGSGVDHVGCHHGLIARNTFTELSANAVQAKGGSTDIEIRWNHMQGAGSRAVNMGGSTGFEYFRPPLDPDAPNAEARDIRVLANIIEGGDTPLAFVGCVDCLAAHNTIVDPDRWLLRILQEATTGGGFAFEPVRDGRLVNNLFFFSRGQLRTDVNIGPSTAPETFSFANNLWYAHDAPDRSRPSLPVAETGAVIGEDPRFTTGLAIGPESPASGAGAAAPEVRGDITGRCYADPPSIGAYEVP